MNKMDEFREKLTKFTGLDPILEENNYVINNLLTATKFLNLIEDDSEKYCSEELLILFNNVFNEFYKENKEIIDEKSMKFGEIFMRGKKISEFIDDTLFYQKIIFSLHMSNSYEEMEKTLNVAESTNFKQLIVEYVNWEEFEKVFSNYCDLKNVGPKIYREEGDIIAKEIFFVLKKKFALS